MRKRAISAFIGCYCQWVVLELAQVAGMLESGFVCEWGSAGRRTPFDVRLSGLLALFSALIGLSMIAVDFTRWMKTRKP
jgi:hypothetical protein